MKLSIKGLAITAAVLWSGAIFIVGICNNFWPTYGYTFLTVIDSIYPGFHAGSGYGSVLIGSLYAALDGGVGGALFAWLYNFIACKE